MGSVPEFLRVTVEGVIVFDPVVPAVNACHGQDLFYIGTHGICFSVSVRDADVDILPLPDVPGGRIVDVVFVVRNIVLSHDLGAVNAQRRGRVRGTLGAVSEYRSLPVRVPLIEIAEGFAAVALEGIFSILSIFREQKAEIVDRGTRFRNHRLRFRLRNGGLRDGGFRHGFWGRSLRRFRLRNRHGFSRGRCLRVQGNSPP